MENVDSGSRSAQRKVGQGSTDARRLRTRRAILEAVERMGPGDAEELTVQSIIERAGVSRSSFYAHFSSIADLAESLMIETMQASARDMERQLQAAPAAATVRATFEQMRDHFVAHRDLYRAALTLPGSAQAFRGAAATLRAINLKYLRSLSSVPATVDIDTVATTIGWAHYGVYDSWLRGDLIIDPDALVDTLFELLPVWMRESSS